MYSIKKILFAEEIPNKPSTEHIALIKEVLSCGNQILENGAFVIECFHEIIKFCRGPLSFHYHAFNTLEQLLNTVLQVVATVIKASSADTDFTSAIPKIVSEIVWLNWDSPVQDVPQIVIKIFLQCYNYGNMVINMVVVLMIYCHSYIICHGMSKVNTESSVCYCLL